MGKELAGRMGASRAEIELKVLKSKMDGTKKGAGTEVGGYE